jgi:sugar lactone lactonase YvrE
MRAAAKPLREARCVWAAQAVLGEAPLWVAAEGALYWVNIARAQVLRCFAAGDIRINDACVHADGAFWPSVCRSATSASALSAANRSIACSSPPRAKTSMSPEAVCIFEPA